MKIKPMKLNNNELQQFKELPIGWEITTLGEVLPISYGKGLTKVKRDESGQYPVFGSSGQVGNHSESFTTRASLIIGRKGSVGQVYYSKLPCWPIDTVYFTEDNDLINLKFFEYLLKGLNLSRLDKSTAVPGLSRDDYNAVEVAIAPSRQQKRIVAEIEKQFSRLDEAVENLKRVKANLKKYKASILKAAVEGKLTEDWRNKNKKDVIPKNIFDIVRNKRIDNYKKLCEQAKMVGKPKPKKPTNIDSKVSVNEDVIKTMPPIPQEWRYVSIAFVTNDKPDSIVDGPFGSSIDVQKDYIDRGIPVIRINNIAPFKFINDNLKYIRKEKFEKLKRHNIMPGDILFGKVGTIGNSCIYPNSMQEGMLSTTGSCRIRVDDALYYKKFLCIVLNAYKSVFNRIASAAVQAFLNMKTIKEFPIPLLSLNEQKIIMKHVDALFSVAERIELQVDQGLIRAKLMRQSVLKKAFYGKLVSQDAQDEPAVKLLERIKAFREKQEMEVKKKSMNRKKIMALKAKPKAKRDILLVLKESKAPMRPEDLFRMAGYKPEEVEDFYADLKIADQQKAISQEKKENGEVFLRAVV